MPTINVLSITGSDGTGGAGIQADVKTITAMGASALSAITSVAVQDLHNIHAVHDLPTEIVVGQVRAAINACHPRAVKVGLVNAPDTIREVAREIKACRYVVSDPGILSTHGTTLMSDSSRRAFGQYIIPLTTLLMLRCNEAELILGITIRTEDDMLNAAAALRQRGAQWVLLRGCYQADGRLTALLSGEDHTRFYTSYNIEGWQRHGVGSAMSAAITTRLAAGDDVPNAVRNAHDFIHAQVVYTVYTDESQHQRPSIIYNRFLELISAHIAHAHDVAFYADNLAITPRYLTTIVRQVVDKSPKQVIDEYLMHQLHTLLTTTSLSIQEVSSTLGFSSPVLLNKFCKTKCGCTPTELRSK